MIGSIMSSILGTQYTLGDLMQIDAKRQGKASQCSVKLIKIYHELKQESLLDRFKSLFGRPYIKVYYLIFKLEVTGDTGNKHTVFIKTNPDFSTTGNWEKNKIKVYCDCADFMYRSAYILNSRNSLFLTPRIKSTLKKALSEKPKKNTGTLLCKHAFAAVIWLIKNYNSIMKTI